MSSHQTQPLDAPIETRAPNSAPMTIRILTHGSYLVATVPVAWSDHELTEFCATLIDRAGAARSRGVIVDLTALDVLDSFADRSLRDLARLLRQRGTHLVIVGIQPEIAFAMLHVGLSLDGVVTSLTLQAGLAHLDRAGRDRRVFQRASMVTSKMRQTVR